MDPSINGSTSLNATAIRHDLTNTVRVDVLGTLNQATRPSLCRMIHKLRSMGIQSLITVDLSYAARVESAALAGLRVDLNATDGGPGDGVSLVLGRGTASDQPEDSAVITILDTSDAPEDGFTLALKNASFPGGPSCLTLTLAVRPLELYSDDELLAASDEVFSLLDDPGAVGGPDLLGHYHDIGQEILRRTPLSGLVDPPGQWQPAG